MVDSTVFIHDTLLPIRSKQLTCASIWPLRALNAPVSDIALEMVDACGSVNSSFANKIACAGLAHTVSLAESAIFEILSEIFGQFTSFISVLVVNLRIWLVDIGVALILVLGGYPSKLTGLKVANLIKWAQVSINVFYWG